MQPKPSEDIPSGEQWIYEIKYDGFRATLTINKDRVQLISRNGKDLSANFPEIIEYCQNKKEKVASLLPLKLDGEIVILNTKYQANFSLLQQRGRFKSVDKITQAARERPAHFMAFDLLQLNGKSLYKNKFQNRKSDLKKVMELLAITYENEVDWEERIGYVASHSDPNLLWNLLDQHLGEGVIAKRVDSNYTEGKSHGDWFKIKNWRTLSGFITAFDQDNGYFEISVFDHEAPIILGKFKHGLEGDELATIKQFLHSNGTKQGTIFTVPPGVCVDVNCLGVEEGELREPQFKQFRFDLKPVDCTLSKVREALSMFPTSIELTKQDKIFWDKPHVIKGDLLNYLRQISPYMLPHVKNRALTLIRCPDGIDGEFFYQKHMPDYAPDYVAGMKSGGETLLDCSSVDALVWFGNHGAIEYHVPFQLMGKNTPIEIVFDLDPPSINEFDLAIFAATLLKQLLDQLQLTSFVKTSGNKGLQVYIPIPENSLTYDETATFTQALALLLEKKHGDLFTTERLKKNRNNRLYLDYIQHGKDKTLIAPYSPRKTDAATVSTPLYWEEITQNLDPANFTIHNVVKRVQQNGCPFISYHQARDRQSLEMVKQFIRG
ncbi:DNA ligase D [Aquibacillus kalidii]|uniref:DNA ligase D n=1 Tax=Aquibacillus kalidii TaxID=2762597 RepID=UPI001F02F80C|nr:DNA ligase D [Aquibacillus kalidii]